MDEPSFLERTIREDERERCALLAEALATRFEASAVRSRKDGSYTTMSLWPPFRSVTCVKPNWEKHAQALEAGAHALRYAIARGCREGWDPRKIKDEPIMPTIFPDPSEASTDR
jgi:hypothetical protein